MVSHDDELKWWQMLFFIFALGAGIAIPSIILGVDFDEFTEGGWEDRLFWSSFMIFCFLNYYIFKKIGMNHPTIREWFINTFLGSIVITFLFMLSTSLFTCILILSCRLLQNGFL